MIIATLPAAVGRAHDAMKKSGFGARTRRNGFVPSLEMAEMRGRPEFRPGGKIDGHHGADVSYRKMLPADKLIVGQARIEPCKEMLKPKTPSLYKRRNLFEGYGPGNPLPFNPGVAFRNASWAA